MLHARSLESEHRLAEVIGQMVRAAQEDGEAIARSIFGEIFFRYGSVPPQPVGPRHFFKPLPQSSIDDVPCPANLVVRRNAGLRLEGRTVSETAEILGLGITTLKARLFRARQKLRVLLTRSPEFRGDRTISKTRERRDSGLNSHPPAERATSRGSRAAGSKARAAASVGWGWRKGTRERTLRSTESRMLDVA